MADKVDFASLMQASKLDTQDRTTRRLKKGEVVEGKVIQIGSDTIFMDVGTTGDARIDRSEFEGSDGKLAVEVGARVRATVVRADASAPVLTLAIGRGATTDLDALRAAWEGGAPVAGRVDRAVKAGLEVDLNGIRAFCPASQVALSYSADLDGFVGQLLEFRVLEIRDGGRSVVVSRRAILEQERRERERDLAEQLRVGAEVSGVVHAVQRHGAVIDLGGIEGFLHISEIAHHRVERVEDVLSEGQHLQASVLSIEESSRGLRVRLSMKALSPAPHLSPPAADEILEGTVSRASSFGLFVETTRGEGVVPVRELDLPPGSDHRRAYPVGRVVRVVVTSHDAVSGRLRFSITGVAKVEERRNFREYSATTTSAAAGGGLGNLGDVLRSKLGLPEPEPAVVALPAQESPPASTTPSADSRGTAEPLVAANQPSRPATPEAGSSPHARKAQPTRSDPEGVVRRRRT